MAEQAMREVTLDEWCSKLWPGHRVNTELARLRAQLAEANEEARDNKIHADDFRAEAAGLKDRLAASESKRKVLEADVSKWKRAWIGRADEASEWRDALARSPYDISPCMGCGKPVVCVPDGMPMCDPCGARAADDAASALEEPR